MAGSVERCDFFFTKDAKFTNSFGLILRFIYYQGCKFASVFGSRNKTKKKSGPEKTLRSKCSFGSAGDAHSISLAAMKISNFL